MDNVIKGQSARKKEKPKMVVAWIGPVLPVFKDGWRVDEVASIHLCYATEKIGLNEKGLNTPYHYDFCPDYPHGFVKESDLD